MLNKDYANQGIEKQSGAMTDIKLIYDSLCDDESKLIFRHRLCFFLTGDYTCIEQMLNDIGNIRESESPELYKWIQAKEYSPTILFGAGGGCQNILKKMSESQRGAVVGICDNNHELSGTVSYGLPVISPDCLKSKYADATVVISTTDYKDDIYHQLVGMGLNKDKIVYPWYGNQYFEDFLPVHENEIFIDAGCYNLNTSYKFIKWCKGNYNKIYAFEPDKSLYNKCLSRLESNYEDRIVIVEKGLWNIKATLNFISDSTGGGNINKTGADKMDAVPLDEFFKGMPEKITFIKMDVEGAELKALEGATEIIKKHKPKLAICIYHNPEDVIAIPLLIKKINPEYKFYIRHYWIDNSETVLFAI